MTDSNTATICDNIALYSHNCIDDAPDNAECNSTAETILELIADSFTDTCLSNDIEPTLWQLVNVFHRQTEQLDRLVDANLMKQRKLTEIQDGSEISSGELEEAISEGHSIQTRLDSFTAMRNAASEQFTQLTGSSWIAKSGSIAKSKAITASMIDSKEMQNARNLQKVITLIPEGKKIAIAPGKSNDHTKIWKVLDTVHIKSPDMVLLHGGSDGVEKIAALWAQQRNVPQVIFKPDWNKHNKAAPFKRNDILLEEFPVGLIVIANDEANGIQQQLIRTARTKSVKIHIVS
ncbi:MAG: DUF2493 domain-containing protein [Pseudomonadota bacterium]